MSSTGDENPADKIKRLMRDSIPDDSTVSEKQKHKSVVVGTAHNVAFNGGTIINGVLEQELKSPNLVSCPECTRPVSRRADPCPHCGFNVREYFGAIHHEQVKKRLARVALVSVGVAGLGYVLSVTFPQVFGTIGLLMMPVGLFFAMAALKAAEKKP